MCDLLTSSNPKYTHQLIIYEGRTSVNILVRNVQGELIMNFKRRGVRSMSSAYSSYHGRIHNTRISTEPKIYSGHGALMNSVCAGHVISGEFYTPTESIDKENRKQDNN